MTIEFESTIHKSQPTVYNALTEGIKVFSERGVICSHSSNNQLGIHTFQLKEASVCDSMENSVITITTTASLENMSILKAVFSYDVKGKSVFKKAFFKVISPVLLKYKAQYFLTDFKCRVEKWG